MANYNQDDTTRWNSEQVRSSSRSSGGRHVQERPTSPLLAFFRVIRYWFCVILISALLAGVSWLLFNDLCAFNHDPATATIEITAEDTVDTIADKLEEAGLIQYKWFFRLFAKLSHAEEKIGIGSYELNSEMDYRALIINMRNGSGNINNATVRITIPEGYTVTQIISLLASKGVNTEAALMEAAQTADFDYSYIQNTGSINRLEGYLFPDTYDFYLNENAANALNRLIHNFDNKMTEDRLLEVENSGYNLRQILTIASLIEKETDGTDQRNISSVIYNRLNDDGSHGTHQMLQIDAALLYALPSDHIGPITNEDKAADSPYNLYQHSGLPPTPIANPGEVAIDAALEPAETNYYYYALSKAGNHVFSETLEQHNAFLASGDYAGN